MTPDFNNLFDWLRRQNQTAWLNTLTDTLPHRFNTTNHGDYATWQTVLESLPDITCSTLDFVHGSVSLNANTTTSAETLTQLKSELLKLHPWRKGPFNLFDVEIDAEWRSDIKWQRLADAVGSLKDKTILDIGCGNGYYMMRMLEHAPKMVIGIDTTLLFIMQFYALQKYLPANNLYALPIGLDELPAQLELFDTIFMMGVLYHRREPVNDLKKIRSWLKPAGTLVLETLIIDGATDSILVPENRYAQMRNVWTIPTVDILIKWLEDCGYIDIQVIDVSVTTIEEQRQTQWMRFQSLQDFLDPEDITKTIEGYPAPTRALITARSP